ncbi:MAG: hypothetical protein CMF59_09155 [Leptospiraceae bacterium]|nr:hypothetical protein [Leptospiraceae bacterium]
MSDEVIQSIQAAFHGVPQPAKITLHVAEAHDNYDYGHDADHRKKDYRGPWQEIPDEHIENCQCALSYLDPEGFRFYLPAFMVWYLKNYKNSRKVKLDNALYALDTYSGEPRLEGHKKEQFSLFSPEQLAACAAFVAFLADDRSGMTDEDFAERIYFNFWHKYL